MGFFNKKKENDEKIELIEKSVRPDGKAVVQIKSDEDIKAEKKALKERKKEEKARSKEEKELAKEEKATSREEKDSKKKSDPKKPGEKKKKKKGKIIGIVLVAIVLVAGGIFGAMKFAAGGSDADAVYVQRVGNLIGYGMNTVTRFSGIVETQKAEKIEVNTGNKIEKIYVKEGDVVEQGDKLFKYSVEAMELELEQGKIEVEKMENSITANNTQIAELEKERANTQTTADYLSVDAQIQQLTADNNSTTYEIKMKNAELKQKEKSIKNAMVKAPISGTIKALVEEKDLSDEEPVLMTILAGNDIRVKGKVNEINIQDIYVGQTVVVRSRIDQNQIWNGEIAEIITDKTSQAEGNEMYAMEDGGERASNYDFYVNLVTTEDLMMGQHITIEPDYGQSDVGKEGIWLSSGYFMLDEDGKASVWKDNGRGRLTLGDVTLGEYDAELDEYEVLEGLTLEDKIAWPDVRCKNGAKTTDTMIWSEDDMSGMDEYIGGDDAGGDMMTEDGEEYGAGEEVMENSEEFTGSDAYMDAADASEDDVIINEGDELIDDEDYGVDDTFVDDESYDTQDVEE